MPGGGGEFKAKVGDVLHFTYGHNTSPVHNESSFEVSIDGAVVPRPEMVYEATNPGYVQKSYVFRAREPGTYHLAIARVIGATLLPPGAQHVEEWTIVVE